MSGECMRLGFRLITTKIWSDGQQSPRHITALRSWTDRVIALRQISVTALFYLENSKRIHPRGVRACWPKDTKRREWGSVPARGGKRESALAPLFICFFLPLGLSYVNWASQECHLFYLKSSLWSSDLSLTFFVLLSQAFTFLVFQPPPFWTPVSYSNYLTFTLRNLGVKVY